jgi:hypothetical protein
VIVLLSLAMSALVFYYIFHLPRSLSSAPEKSRAAYLTERKEAVYENLRDLNFEYNAGKLPEKDYFSMKASLEEEAAALLAEIARLEHSPRPFTGKPESVNH